jgi:hypothetical protein
MSAVMPDGEPVLGHLPGREGRACSRSSMDPDVERGLLPSELVQERSTTAMWGAGRGHGIVPFRKYENKAVATLHRVTRGTRML